MKKYIWTYKAPNCELVEDNVEKLCDSINKMEDEKIIKWQIFNYLQKKIKRPNPIVLRISRIQI
tara:strand:+ start:107 stop:298 length:192 start_codon:yes stop_codon:yes gene_type:complete